MTDTNLQERWTMPKYLISWEETVWMDLEIEAESEEEAIQKFDMADYDREDVKEVGQEWIPDSLDIVELP